MGQRTTVSGHIQESWYVPEDEMLDSMSLHNDEVLDALPTRFYRQQSGTGINYLTRAMFCTTEGVDGPHRPGACLPIAVASSTLPARTARSGTSGPNGWKRSRKCSDSCTGRTQQSHRSTSGCQRRPAHGTQRRSSTTPGQPFRNRRRSVCSTDPGHLTTCQPLTRSRWSCLSGLRAMCR